MAKANPDKCGHHKGCRHRRSDHIAAQPPIIPAYCRKCTGSQKPDHEFVDQRQVVLIP